ncbi:cAMP-dependent protein kinase subunit [Ancistrocladus abbreviatus]
MGALGGQFDNEAGNINVLYRFSTCVLSSFLMTDSYILFQELVIIRFIFSLLLLGHIVVLYPLAFRQVGLKWDLSKFIVTICLVYMILRFLLFAQIIGKLLGYQLRLCVQAPHNCITIYFDCQLE